VQPNPTKLIQFDFFRNAIEESNGESVGIKNAEVHTGIEAVDFGLYLQIP
jgi:hypothetical protein